MKNAVCNKHYLLLLQLLAEVCYSEISQSTNLYLCQGSYVLSLFVCLLATLHKNFQMDSYEIFREG